MIFCGVLLGRFVLGIEHELGVERRLVRIGDARELLDLAREGLLVEALHVALGADLDRGLDEHLDEAVPISSRASSRISR